jgi:protein DGCR14
MAATQPGQALVKRSATNDVALMPPPKLTRIKRPATVLDEDDYTQALSDIIARDYFPGLLESQVQHEYLAALDSGNEAWIAEAAQKLREAAAPNKGHKRRTARNTRFDSTHSATPMRAADTPVGNTGGDTPMSVAGSEASETTETTARDLKLLDTSTLSLGTFQAKYTSEDNESFNALLDKQNNSRRQKHAYMWTQDQRIPSARQIAHRAREQRLLQQKADEEAAGGKALIPMSAGATADRPAKPDSWTIKKPDNSFMFHPPSVDEDGLQTVQQVKEQTSKAGAKEVVHANTRFPALSYIDDPGPVPPSPSLNTDIIAQRDAKRASSLATTTDFEGDETPRVNGYAYVDEDEPENLVTSSSSTPSYRDLLAGQVGDGTPNPFKINEIRKREDLHLRMVEKQARKKREQSRDVSRTMAVPGAGSGVGGKTPAGNMTPAARRLMEKLGAMTPGRGGGNGAGKRESVTVDWTPGRTPRKKVAK